MSSKLSSTIFWLCVVVFSMFAGFQTSQYLSPQAPSNQQQVGFDHETIIGQQRPDFTLADLIGKQRSIEEWDGKILIINFWATWCPPCREEIPEFIHLQEEYAEKGVQFLGVALQTAEEVQPFYDEHGMNYPSLVGQQDVVKVAKAYGNVAGALPYSVIISPSGKIEFTKRGPLDTETARKVIDSLL